MHSDVVHRTWSGLDGRLIFDFTIRRDSDGDRPSSATVYCRGQMNDARVVSIYENRPASIDWTFRSGVSVRGVLRQEANVHIGGVPSTGIFADIYFRAELEHHFEGLIATCPNDEPPDPPFPPEPPLPGPPSPIPIPRVSPGDALFNYIYLRRWPQPTSDNVAYGFIRFAPSSPPWSTFYDDLCAASQQSRQSAETLALRFIDGDAPYQGEFLSHWEELSGPISDFPRLARRARAEGANVEWFVRQLTELVERVGMTGEYFTGTAYRFGLGRIWQSYFALVVTLGYDWALLVRCGQALWVAHIIEMAIRVDADGVLHALPLTPEDAALVLEAHVLLPRPAFPLPPAHAPTLSTTPTSLGWMEPYAIGDLQLVKQRLLRYVPGEIARIDNVMRGERREVTRREMRGQVDTREAREEDSQLLENDDSDEQSSLLEQARRLVAEKAVLDKYDHFTTNYGPPAQGTVDGTLTRTTTQGPNPAIHDKTRFAHDVLSQTLQRIRRRVSSQRATTSVRRVENVVSSVVDNTAGQSHIRAVFRWVNTVYEVYVVNYGSRLMLEFMLDKPAAAYIARAQAQTGAVRQRPTALANLGIHSFRDINSSNYAELGGRYGAVDLTPPPASTKIVALSLRGGEDKLLAVPRGYEATLAYVASVCTPPGLPAPTVLVGRQTFDGTAASAPLRAYGEDTLIPISVGRTAQTLSPPSDAEVLVNVEVECQITPQYLDAWRIKTYQALLGAYEQQASIYFESSLAGHRSGQRSPLQNQQTVREALEQGCIRILIERTTALIGPIAGSTSPPKAVVYEPRYRQFFSNAIEWSEMSYSFEGASGVSGHPVGELDDTSLDDPFTAFLQAAHSRVLVPVRPQRVVALLYALSSGNIWDADDYLVPTSPTDLMLVSDLEQAEREREVEQPIGPAWQLVVPTAMQVLDDAAFFEGM